jgi:hypothetical protein
MEQGRSVTWDVTVADTTAASYIAMSSTCAASAAEAAAQRKNTKYSNIAQSYLFYPVAVKTMGPIIEAGQDFITELGHRISSVTEDPRETSTRSIKDSIQIKID